MIFRALSRFCPLLLLLMLAGAGWAQPLPDRYPLSGVAVDSAGKPLSGVVITLRRQEDSGAYVFWGGETATDARGAFRFGLAETGRYYLSAESEGFAPISNQTVIWNSGDGALRLRFQRLVTLKLQLFAPAGPNSTKNEVSAPTPLANSAVWVRLRGDGVAGQTTRRALTDGSGRLTISKILPASYAIYISTPSGFALHNNVALSAETSLRSQLQSGGNFKVSVKQFGESQRFLGGATLNLTPADFGESIRLMGDLADPGENFAYLASGADFSALVSRDGDGSIEISHLPPGNYLANVRLPGYSATPARPITIEDGKTSAITIEISPAENKMSSLTLDLRQPSASIANDSATIEAPRGEFSLRLLPITANGALATDESPDDLAFSPGGNSARRALADESGQIAIFPLRVGRYRVFVAPRSPINASDEDGSGANLNSAASVSIDIDVPPSGGAGTLTLPGAPR